MYLCTLPFSVNRASCHKCLLQHSFYIPCLPVFVEKYEYLGTWCQRSDVRLLKCTDPFSAITAYGVPVAFQCCGTITVLIIRWINTGSCNLLSCVNPVHILIRTLTGSRRSVLLKRKMSCALTRHSFHAHLKHFNLCIATIVTQTIYKSVFCSFLFSHLLDHLNIPPMRGIQIVNVCYLWNCYSCPAGLYLRKHSPRCHCCNIVVLKNAWTMVYPYKNHSSWTMVYPCKNHASTPNLFCFLVD